MAWRGSPVPFLWLQVAIKLSSWRWRGQQALRLHPRVEVGRVVDVVLALLEKLEEEESVLVEAVCPPARLPFPGEGPLSQRGWGLGLASWLLCAGLRPPWPSRRQHSSWP